jgi:carbon storage regulator
MLVLSRKEGESLCFGDNIRVMIVRIAGGTVRIGIEAPNGTSIMRQELYVAMQQEETETQPGLPNGTNNVPSPDAE